MQIRRPFSLFFFIFVAPFILSLPFTCRHYTHTSSGSSRFCVFISFFNFTFGPLPTWWWYSSSSSSSGGKSRSVVEIGEKNERFACVCVETRVSHCFCCLSFNPNGLEGVLSRVSLYFFFLFACCSLVISFSRNCYCFVVCEPPEAERVRLFPVFCHRFETRAVTVIKLKQRIEEKLKKMMGPHWSREWRENLLNGRREN